LPLTPRPHVAADVGRAAGRTFASPITGMRVRLALMVLIAARQCRPQQTHYQRDPPSSLRWHRGQDWGRIAVCQHRPGTAKGPPLAGPPIVSVRNFCISMLSGKWHGAMPLVAGTTWIFDGVGPCAPPVYQMVFPENGRPERRRAAGDLTVRGFATSIGPSVTLMTLSGAVAGRAHRPSLTGHARRDPVYGAWRSGERVCCCTGPCTPLRPRSTLRPTITSTSCP